MKVKIHVFPSPQGAAMQTIVSNKNDLKELLSENSTEKPSLFRTRLVQSQPRLVDELMTPS